VKLRVRSSRIAKFFPILICCALGRFAYAQNTHPSGAVHRSHPNVLLVTIDTVRADHVGCYGYSQIHTPTLDRLAHDGVVFERAFSQVPLTWPSHTAILTGTYPYQNGVEDFTGKPLDPQFRSVTQAFQHSGYVTGAVVSSYVLDRAWGLGRGFDFYDDAFAPDQFRTKDIGLVERKAGESVSHAIEWLSKSTLTHRPFFLWLHLYDPHSPYDPPEPFHTEYAHHLYDGEIAYADHELGRLIAWLGRNELYDSTLIVVLSDHGESLGEHGEQEHGFFLYDPTIRIPLTVKPPAASGLRPTRIAAPVETIAVAPTLLKLASVEDEIQKQFTSPPLPLKGIESADDRPAYSETFYPFNSFGWSPLHSLQTLRYHYIDAPRPELYDVEADPDEKNNLASQQSATVSVFKAKLQALLARQPYQGTSDANTHMSPDTLQKLRALGYVAYHSPVSPQAVLAGLPDPKDKLGEFNAILSADDSIRAGNLAAADEELRQLQQQDPSLYIVPFLLGENQSRRQDWQASATEFRRSLELNPNFDQAMTGLSRALYFLGNLEEARLWAQNALKENPLNYKALYQLGAIDSRRDPASAIADYQKAIAIQGKFAPVRRDLGMLYFERQNYSDAAKELEKAAELGVDDARLFNFLGICYDRTGQLTRAVATYEKALERDSNLAEAHLNLGFTYHRLGRESLARAEYRRACELKGDFCHLSAPSHSH
jgi:choline-sulfatase